MGHKNMILAADVVGYSRLAAPINIASRRDSMGVQSDLIGHDRHLGCPATGIHVERSCGALDDLLRDHDLVDALEAW
jgi:hypothetical protein